MAEHFLGIDIGGTTCAACLGDGDGNLLDSRSVPTAKGKSGWKSTVNLLIRTAREMVAAHDVGALEGIGISCGSPMDQEQGQILEPANLPGWKKVPIVDLLQHEFDGAPAWLENDANAGALAELAFGAGRDSDVQHLLFLTFGTGLGAGLILNGKLYSGASGYAGEIGHVRLAPYGPAGCGKPGSFEGFCSGSGIQQIALIERRAWFKDTVLPQTGFDARDVGLGAAQGDALCVRILEIAGEYLGRGLAILLDVLNPQLIVIGSVFARCESHLRPSMLRTLGVEARAETLSACRIVPAALGENIGNWSALGIAYYRAGILEHVRQALSSREG